MGATCPTLQGHAQRAAGEDDEREPDEDSNVDRAPPLDKICLGCESGLLDLTFFEQQKGISYRL